MMEVIRKKICFDKSKSHVQSITPYIQYNDDDTDIKFVNDLDVDGNFGHFACDFARVTSCVCGTTLQYLHEIIDSESNITGEQYEEARYRFCDIIKHYNYIQDKLNNAIFGKVVIFDEEIADTIDCINSELNTSHIETHKSIITNYIEMKEKYDFYPVDSMFFEEVNDNMLYYIPTDNVDEDPIIQNKRTDVESHLTNGTYLVLIEDYDTVMKYENEWENWWNRWFGDGWEQMAFGDMYQPIEDGTYFKFCQDVERYVIGKVKVPEIYNGEEITGVYVPDYVCYADIKNYLDWFSDRDIPNKDSKLLKTWNDKGGDVFYAFLQNVEKFWISENTQHDFTNNNQQIRVSYVKPYIEVPIHLTNETQETWTYESFIENSQPFSAIGVFSGYTQFNDSHFVEYQNLPMVESRLERVMSENTNEVNGHIGVWSNFAQDNNQNLIFACTYQTGNSQTTGFTLSQTINNKDGSFTKLKIDSETVEEVSPQVFNVDTKRVVISKKEMVNESFSEIITEGEMISGNISAITVNSAYTSYVYGWWECIPIDENMDVVCGDGEEINAVDSKYRSVETLSLIPRLISDVHPGDTYYFLPNYDNGICIDTDTQNIDNDNISRFRIPYENNSFHNMSFCYENDGVSYYIGDYIPDDGIMVDNGLCTIKYVIGGLATYDENNDIFTEVHNTGIHYVESYPFTEGIDYVTIGQFLNVPFYYNTIETDNDLTTVYHEDYRLYRNTRRAKITGMEIANTWTNERSMIAPLITSQSTEYLQNTPNTLMNITIDRGNASAFESYFKLSECNSLEDLTNYSNNFFNL